jgi:hypothetical protein
MGFGLYTGVCFFTAISGEGVGDIRGLFPPAGMFSYLVTVGSSYAGDLSSV